MRWLACVRGSLRQCVRGFAGVRATIEVKHLVKWNERRNLKGTENTQAMVPVGGLFLSCFVLLLSSHTRQAPLSLARVCLLYTLLFLAAYQSRRI